MKKILIILLFAVLIVLGSIKLGEFLEPSSNITAPDSATANWTSGQDISPLPAYGDCDDEALYTKYWLEAAGFPNIILTGLWVNPKTFIIERHVWIRAFTANNTYDYDKGIGWQGSTFVDYAGLYNVKEISLYQLVQHVDYDLRNK